MGSCCPPQEHQEAKTKKREGRLLTNRNSKRVQTSEQNELKGIYLPRCEAFELRVGELFQYNLVYNPLHGDRWLVLNSSELQHVTEPQIMPAPSEVWQLTLTYGIAERARLSCKALSVGEDVIVLSKTNQGKVDPFTKRLLKLVVKP